VATLSAFWLVVSPRQPPEREGISRSDFTPGSRPPSRMRRARVRRRSR